MSLTVLQSENNTENSTFNTVKKALYVRMPSMEKPCIEHDVCMYVYVYVCMYVCMYVRMPLMENCIENVQHIPLVVHACVCVCV